jgi:hypothetical protein
MEDVVSEEHPIVAMEIAAPRDVVWRALREPEQIAQWFGWEAPSLAEEIKFIFVDGATADEAAGTISFGEWEGNTDRIEIAAVGERTSFRMVRRGPVPAEGWGVAYDEVYEGWITFFQQLRHYLERHRGDRRRTLWFSSKSGPGTIEAIGLIGAGAAGTRCERELSPGDRVSGEVWHWSRHQLGVLVEEWSGGLIVVADRTGGGGTALLTVHGLDDAEFAALENRWRTWWGTAYPQSPAE